MEIHLIVHRTVSTVFSGLRKYKKKQTVETVPHIYLKLRGHRAEGAMGM
jgi:hypothetical protein